MKFGSSLLVRYSRACGAVRRRGTRALLLTRLLCTMVASAWCGACLARAGGGGGFGGGGGGGFGGGGGGFGGGGGGFGGGFGGGGGGSGGDLGPAGIAFIVVVVVIIMVISSVASAKGVQAHRGRTIRQAHHGLDERRRRQGIRQLQEKDPAFDEQSFADRVTTAFHKIQAAWCGQDLSPIRPFVSDGTYERFSLQIQEQQDFGYRSVMQDIRVHSCRVAQILCDTAFDVATLKIDASAVDYRADLKSGREIPGSRLEEHFTEFWSFVRRSGAKSGVRSGLIEGTCPNCGTPLEMTQFDRCQSCESLLFSGEHDWVLAEITQASEWRPTKPESTRIAAYRETRDAKFNVQHVEDRTSVIFWRKVMADRLGDARPLAKMASEEFARQYSGNFEAQAGQRYYLGDCAVGAVDLRGLLPGEPLDRALVAVTWDGAFTTVGEDGQRRQRSGRSLRRSLFVLGRQAGAEFNLEQAIRSSHCPNCGAPQSQLTSHECDFCGTVLNDGSRDWILLEIHNVLDPAAKQLLREADEWASRERSRSGEAAQLSDAAESPDGAPQGMTLLAWTIHEALADRQLDPQEEKLIRHAAEIRNIPASRVDKMLRAAEKGQLDVPEPASREQGRAWLAAMADAGLADGRIDHQEARLLAQAGARFEFSRYDVRQLLRRRQRALYQEARAQSRRDDQAP